jgi:hypothetical protein
MTITVFTKNSNLFNRTVSSMQVLRDIPFNRISFQHLYRHSWQNPAFAQVLLLKTPSKTSTSIPVHLIRAPDISEKVVQMAAELLPQLPVNPFLVNLSRLLVDAQVAGWIIDAQVIA